MQGVFCRLRSFPFLFPFKLVYYRGMPCLQRPNGGPASLKDNKSQCMLYKVTSKAKHQLQPTCYVDWLVAGLCQPNAIHNI